MDANTRQEMYYKAIYDKWQHYPAPVTRVEIYLCKAIEHIRTLEAKIDKLSGDNSN